MQRLMKRTALAFFVLLTPCTLFAQWRGYMEPLENPIYEEYLRMGYTYDEIQEAEQAAAESADSSEYVSVMSSSSYIDWTKQTFVSDVSLDVEKAGIPMPSGKALSLNRIQMELPVLIKDPLLSLYVDDSRTLGDMVLEGMVTLDELTRIIDNSKQTPAFFKNATSNLNTTHTIDLQDIGALLVKHKRPYIQEKPIERIASRAYTGIVIDARGSLPVHGEHITSVVSPCLFPRVWNEDMTLVYERNMVTADIAKKTGIVDYLQGQGSNKRTKRAGRDPLWISAKAVYGVNRCDPVISREDYLRITSVPENLELLQQGKVVILLDNGQISHAVSAPQKDIGYYLELSRITKYIQESPVPDLTVEDSDKGLVITMDNLRFIADSAELLPEDRPRVQLIANKLKELLSNGDFTIRVDGHTAHADNSIDPKVLSQDRAKAIVDALIADGIDSSIISWYGYGDSMPAADNDTPEGRAKNRRVEIIAMPRASFVQRR